MAAKKTPPRRKPIKKAGAKRPGASSARSHDGEGGDHDVVEGKAEEVRAKKPGASSPLAFLQQVRAEASKVTWTSRNETMISTVMVLIMVVIMAVFFFFVDQTLRFGVCTILPIDCVSRDAL
ncbi:MAG: preprotein translocase subunit SecE [Alphaproteobacteria bacterium]|nr:preprotein translocase subunit SecE [Alphaproteobacteria bacterium]